MPLQSKPFSGPNQQRGFALFLGMVFLLMLTLVAVTAMRGTSLELNMANNTANQEFAFEGAESARSAMTRIIRDHVACSFRFSTGATFSTAGGGGSACISGSCSVGGGGGGVTAAPANYPWEPRLKLVPPGTSLENLVLGENVNDPTTYVSKFEMAFANSGTANVGAVMLSSNFDNGSPAVAGQGYEANSKGGVNYFEVTSRAAYAATRANVAGHYRLMMRDAEPQTCLTSIAFTP